MTRENVKFVSPLITSVAIKQRRAQKGYNKFELSVAVAIFAILVTVLLQRLWFYQAQAELTAVQQVVANVRSALEIKLAQGRLPGRGVDPAQLAIQNPLDWLTHRPANYAGEYFSPTSEEVAPGNWYFDRRDKTLVYLLNNGNTFGSSQSKRLKFKVKLLRLPKTSAKPPGAPDVDGVTFEPVNG
jgi:general secretion pathway protein G